jgi:cytochrome c-type biogenesis protein CcmE
VLNRGISTLEAARRLGIDLSQMHQILHTGQLPSRRRNGQRVITEGAVQEYQARKRLASRYQDWY